MSLFAIADTHLSFGTDKPMDDFNGWNNYVERLQNNWNSVVQQDDYVVIAGDISWAMNFEELIPDFNFINNLNGKKIIIKGNHDYWWSTISKMNKFIEEHNYDTISFVHNSSIQVNDYIVCGSRGWMIDSCDEQDAKVYNREVMRLKASIDYLKSDKEKIVFIHYPPVTANGESKEILNLLNENGIKKCFYGHLHGMAIKYAIEGNVDDIDFSLISCDHLNFTPLLIKKF